MSTAEATLANHGARIKNVEDGQKELARKFDRLQWWIMGTLAAALTGVFLQLLRLAK